MKFKPASSGLIIIVAVAEPFVAGGAQFFLWNASKKAVYDGFQVFGVYSKL